METQQYQQVVPDLLAPGGRLSLVVPTLPKRYGKIAARLGYYRRYNKRMFLRTVEDSGLIVRKMHYINRYSAIRRSDAKTTIEARSVIGWRQTKASNRAEEQTA